MTDAILSLDPSINETGWALGCGPEPQFSGVIKTKGQSHTEKLTCLRNGLREILGKKEHPIALRALIETPEGFTYARSAGWAGKGLNQKSLMILSRAIGVLAVECSEWGMSVTEIPPTWKTGVNKALAKGLTGKTNHNEADAVLLYRWYRANRNGREHRRNRRGACGASALTQMLGAGGNKWQV